MRGRHPARSKKPRRGPRAALVAASPELATTVATLVRAIDWASERGVRLINLSLGTPNEFREAELAPAVQRAVQRGSIIVSAYEHDDRLWYPGAMDGVVGVLMDADQERETVSPVDSNGRLLLGASGFPRPIPGVPLDRNLNGISFAVANATGVLARSLADRGEIITAAAALDLFTQT